MISLATEEFKEEKLDVNDVKIVNSGIIKNGLTSKFVKHLMIADKNDARSIDDCER